MRTATGWVGVLWVGLLTLSGPARAAEPPETGVQGYNVPGRSPDSKTPWELFLGHAAHQLIAFMYGVNHEGNTVYYNTKSIRTILTGKGAWGSVCFTTGRGQPPSRHHGRD